MNILKVLMWLIFGAWVCFLGYCANGHNKYQPNRPTMTADPHLQSTPQDKDGGVEKKVEDNIDGPKTFFIEEHDGGIRGGGRRKETPYDEKY